MGIYTEYLDQQLSFEDLTKERKKQLRKISQLRGGRDVLVFAADLNKGTAPVAMIYADLLPINDQLDNLKGTKLDLILETPGGYAEVAEDVVGLIRRKYSEIGVIVPGWAKSAGTIMAMAADEILMEPASALGPIDAQLNWQGKVFSAGELLDGMEKIKKEVLDTGVLNKAYIPILQAISPGELQRAQNAQDFAKVLVMNWLANYKFKNWAVHSSSGQPVTTRERESRAEEIADILRNHARWLTHGRSIKLDDLKGMKLLITDYSTIPDLADAIRRYHVLMQMSFATNIYKIFETAESQIYRFLGVPVSPPEQVGIAELDFRCSKCNSSFRIQANLGKSQPLKPGCLPFPKDNKFTCPSCNAEHDLSDTKRQIEAQSKQKVVE